MKTQNNRYKEIYTNTNFKTWFCKSVEEQVMSAHNGTYKTASSKWAGGDTFYIINFTDEETEVSASGVTETVWSKNGKWSGNNLNVDICAHKSVIQLDMLTTAGVLNLFIERIGNKKYRAKWVEQARGYNLKVVEGYILHGIHIKGSLKSAEAKINKIRRDRYFKAKSIKVLKNLDNVSVLSRIWVSTSDSLKSGNCKSRYYQFY